MSYPTHATVTFQKDVLQKQIDEGEFHMGDPISNTEYTVYHVDNVIIESKKYFYGRLISLREIRSQLLEKHHKLGIVRCTDTSINSMTTAELRTYLEGIHEPLSTECSIADLQSQATKCITTRYLKVWHDNGPIASNGHLLVMVAAIYDKAFYYTVQEMADRGYTLDVPSIVEQPQIHMLLRCGSSELEQAATAKYRIPCLQQMEHSLQIQTNCSETVEEMLFDFFMETSQLSKLKVDRVREVLTLV